ncbi:MAG: hypothetical protein GY754_03885 [bacterium]|nr:hypothetical protein [bacterium]
MKKATKALLLVTAIAVELKMADLYSLYYKLFDEDKDFWYQLMIEEKNHAALLKSARDQIQESNLPDELLCSNIEELQQVIDIINEKIELYRSGTPSKKKAYVFAIKIKNIGYEKHYQDILTGSPNSGVVKIMQEVNNQEINHAHRIEEIMD